MSVDTNNAEFQDALNLIQYTRQSVFLTGKAGTGKSTFLRYVCENTKKKHVVLAPTGIAAINAGGSTMHRRLLLRLSMSGLYGPVAQGRHWRLRFHVRG